ncbi:mast cell protease 1A-like [Pholidichthys leucotaenia]
MAAEFLLLLFVFNNGADGSHIVGGRDAAPHSRPYMVSLQIQGVHFCGGALLREDFVVTAAHCEEPIPYTVVLGADTLKGNETTKQVLSVVKSFPHPNYGQGLKNDIMLLKLNTSAQLTEAVQEIQLKTGRLRAGSRCIIAGWGDIGDNNTLANRLQEVNATILARQECQKRWGKVPITRAMVCAVGAHDLQGFCSGDSGGPLVCDGAAAGVVSFSGRRCGDLKRPDVYTRMSSYRKWIKNVLKNN